MSKDNYAGVKIIMDGNETDGAEDDTVLRIIAGCDEATYYLIGNELDRMGIWNDQDSGGRLMCRSKDLGAISGVFSSHDVEYDIV